MVERDGWKPRYKRAAFNAGEQGGNGGSHKIFGLTEEQKRTFRVEVGRLQIRNLSRVQSETHDNNEIAKAEYYKFHAAVTLVGVDPQQLLYDLQHKLKRTPEELQAWRDTLDRGAKTAALGYLIHHDPHNQTAMVIVEQGVYAPLQAHQDFSEAVDTEMQKLLEKYYPEALADPDPELFE